MTRAEYLAALPPIDPEWLAIIEEELRGDWDEPHEAPPWHWDRVHREVEQRIARDIERAER